jgi:hypothetical protein
MLVAVLLLEATEYCLLVGNVGILGGNVTCHLSSLSCRACPRGTRGEKRNKRLRNGSVSGRHQGLSFFAFTTPTPKRGKVVRTRSKEVLEVRMRAVKDGPNSMTLQVLLSDMTLSNSIVIA